MDTAATPEPCSTRSALFLSKPSGVEYSYAVATVSRRNRYGTCSWSRIESFSKNKFLIILGDAQIVRKSESKQKTQVKGILLFSAIEIRNLFDQFDFALIVSLTKRNYRA